ncbi:hypothetical protein ACS5PK_00875 [Roseateles sp. DB2]|uniref:hypothetical protein n=1 Tax=Roseateles sp. DB2 TaxID=3453717 RepID=UPI003EEED0CA
MRLAFGLVGLLLVLAIVMLNARNSARQLAAVPQPGAVSAPGTQGQAGAGDTPGPRARTEAVREQVQGLADQAAQRASEAGAP